MIVKSEKLDAAKQYVTYKMQAISYVDVDLHDMKANGKVIYSWELGYAFHERESEERLDEALDMIRSIE